MTSLLPPVHAGEILRDEYLVPLKMSAGALAKHLDVPRTRIERIAKEETAITPDTALRLAKLFRTSPEFWMNLQGSLDLKRHAEALKDESDGVEATEVALRSFGSHDR